MSKIVLFASSMVSGRPALIGALQAVVDSLEGIPEALHGEYVEKGGKFELQVSGMRTEADVQRVQNALTKERSDHGALKQRVSLLGEHKIEDVVTILDRVPELEAAAAGKLDPHKIDEIVETRIKSRLAPVERERDSLKVQLTEKDTLLDGFSKKEKTRTIHDRVREAATKAKLLPEAIDDALLLADRTFELEEGTNKVVTKDGIGVTPGVDPEVWFSDLQTKRPHWWGGSAGGGAAGQRQNVGGGTNPWSHDHWNMTEQGRLYNENRERAEQMAKAAGTSIGGAKPAKK